MRGFVHSVFLAEFFFFQTVNRGHFCDAVELLGELYVSVFIVLALLNFGAKEVNYPDFLATVEFTHRTEIEGNDVRVRENVRKNFLLLLTSLLEMEVELTTTSSEKLAENIILVKAALTLALTLLILAYSFCSGLVVNASLIGVRQHIVGIGDFLELFFRRLRIVQVLVWVVLNGELFKLLLDLRFCRVLFEAHNLVVVIFRFGRFFLLLLLLLLVVVVMVLVSLVGESYTQMVDTVNVSNEG